jgi:hypothetical protein
MKCTLTALTIAATMFANSASAFDPAHLQRLIDTNRCVGCDLRKATLAEEGYGFANLRGANLEGANLYQSGLTDARLDGANLRGANLAGTLMWKTSLIGADLTGADLRATILKGALNLRAATFDNLRGAILDGLDLTGVDLGGKDLSGAKFAGALNLRAATFDNLRGAILDGLDLICNEDTPQVHGNVVQVGLAQFCVLPEAGPLAKQESQHQNDFQVPAGWSVVTTNDSDFGHISAKVIAGYSWGPHVIFVESGNSFAGFAAKGFDTPGHQTSHSFIEKRVGSAYRLTSTSGRLLIRRFGHEPLLN